ncbi:amylo-alpha-1,6-glucosidase [Rubrivivax gelatinosus]|uniref:Glycogen debranching enzyme n=1 Tax=Rubrivivax gelatinosus TaxID=28068 RepID=A0A4R2MGW6_RUBGE|nr:amylo-alpha-1,6-glucosidase [Rubrivivax gelatinosus]MBK1685900.1 amylo-alpha-1,6-glucosidase [Rubrivivax gelatinosus]TCP04077.1 glycogen debranching enzyme [Rubrivivax gelatinosus]
MSAPIRIGDQWYVTVAAARADNNPYVLKSDDSFALFDRLGDIRAWGEGEQGLYHRDTRYLSRHELLVDGLRPMFLGATVKERNNLLIVEAMNPDLLTAGELRVPKGEVHVFRAKLLWDDACWEHLRFTHHGLAPADIELALQFDADFRDLFEVRGTARTRRGVAQPPRRQGDTLEFAYDGLDGQQRTTRVTLQPSPDAWGEREARYTLHLEPGAELHLYCTVCCDVAGAPRLRAPGYDAAFRANAQAREQQARSTCRVHSSNPLVERWLERSVADVAMLTTELPTGPYPYAGVPWYSTTFGRDGLITAREMLWADPALARGVLEYLAASQAVAEDDERDAEPGKILHEARQCEMARTREVPFERYYGTIDATPLFVALAGAYWRRTADLGFVRRIWPHVRAALDWIERWGDRDGDGFVEYARRSSRGLAQQGWKDSHDSVFHADGRLAEAPIALCEVQAYVYEARREGAELAAALGEPALAERLRAQAQALRLAFQERFWCEELGLYAIALDGAKQPCRVAASNAGHTMWTGIASPEHAARMARRFGEPDFWSGWGIRTVAAGQARYNPMSYHNGSIWPHDNALIAMGLARYGHTDAAARVMEGLFEATLHFAQHRMPELFCGFHRRDGEGPTLYPVACAPQAWSAAALFGMLQAQLGLEIDAPARLLTLRSPRLPAFVDWLALDDLRIGEASVDLLLRRHDRDVGVQIRRQDGPLEVRVAV